MRAFKNEFKHKEKINIYIHPTARIDCNTIEVGTKIWHYTHICSGVVIGKNCIIGQNVYIGPGVHIGSGCKIQNNAYIPAGVTIEEDVFIGPAVTFTNISLIPRAFISKKDKFGETLVKKGASIGANATIICGNAIGEYAMVGAGTVLTKSVSNFGLVIGNPGLIVGKISKDGSDITYFEEKWRN